jgi:hypothetical protein
MGLPEEIESDFLAFSDGQVYNFVLDYLVNCQNDEESVEWVLRSVFINGFDAGLRRGVRYRDEGNNP